MEVLKICIAARAVVSCQVAVPRVPKVVDIYNSSVAPVVSFTKIKTKPHFIQTYKLSLTQSHLALPPAHIPHRMDYGLLGVIAFCISFFISIISICGFIIIVVLQFTVLPRAILCKFD